MEQTWASSSPPAAPGPVLGIDIGGTKIELALADRNGEIIARVRIATAADQGPDSAMERIGRAAASLLADHAQSAPCAVGVVAPGVIQPDRILLAPNLLGWQHIGLAARIGRLLGMDTVAVTNDVKAAALAEARHGALVGCDPGLYVNLGTGLGAAIVIGGQVINGKHHAAGEIAYIASGGSALTAGENLEDVIGGKSLIRRAAEHLGTPIQASTLFTATDPRIREFVDHALDTLATAVANMAILLDPDRIVVGGGMMASAEVVLPVLQAKITGLVPFPPDLQTAHFVQNASLHGAIALAIDAAKAADHREIPIGAGPRRSGIDPRISTGAFDLGLAQGVAPQMKESRT